MSWKDEFSDASLEKRRIYQRQYIREKRAKDPQKYKKRNTDATKKHRLLNREKYLARKKLEYRVRVGQIIPSPCAVCGDSKVEAHHPDYSRPLDVLWLCRPHHSSKHLLLGRR